MKSKRQFTLLLLFLIWSVSSLCHFACVDINTTNISPKDYRSQVRFANLAPDVGSATSIRIDGEAYGSLAFGEGGSYKDISAGFRKLSIAFSQVAETSYTKIFETDRKGTMFIVGGGSPVEQLFATERYIFEAPGVSDGALVRVFHASPDAGTLRVTVKANGPPLALASGLGYKNATAYLKLIALSDTLTAISGTDTLVKNVVYQFASNKRYTIAVYDRKKSIKHKIFVDD